MGDTSGQKGYQAIMGANGGGVEALSARLVSFRQWLHEAGCKVHPAVCIVNGEATDGTKNAPVLLLDTSSSNNSSNSKPPAEERCGLVDREEDRVLYDRTIGCQVRTAREIKEDQVMMTVPRSVMIHPDLIAASDAGRVALACCEPINDRSNFWDAFGNTAEREKSFLDKIGQSSGPQLLVKILQERKRVEAVLKKATKNLEQCTGGKMPDYKLAKKNSITTRAVVLCFLIQQRFADEEKPQIARGEFSDNYSTLDDACMNVDRILPSSDTPETFGPYARTLPPAVPLPICWKRNELALLANCISGLSLLTEVAAQIMTLSADLISLVEAGILHRFPLLFSQNILTWDRWLWAASVHTSRLLPATCYLNKGELKADQHQRSSDELFYSPAEVWDELGVMVPLIDMLNHESEAAQIKWESPSFEESEIEMDASVAKVVMHKRVKKGLQIYTNYGIESNKELLLRYGFAQMANSADTASIGWGLSNCVGKIPPPSDYISIDSCSEEEITKDSKYLVFESTDADEIKSWWTEKRLRVMEHQIASDEEFWKLLRSGKKMTATVSSDGTIDPILLTAVVTATMPPRAINKYLDSMKDKTSKITISKRHQRVMRKYLLFLFCRKLEKLMASLDSGLGNQFGGVKLWKKVTEGGLNYKLPEDNPGPTGWFSFFDSFAYITAMEVENGCFYAIAPDSCVLTFYDGHLRALQASIDSIISQNKFEESVLKQLQDLDFVVAEKEEEAADDDDYDDYEESENKMDISSKAENDKSEQDSERSGKQDSLSQKQNASNGAGGKSDSEKKERRRNRRSRVKSGSTGSGQGPPALKLHIGNLSYQTPPSRLFDFFASQYGRDNVLECHIPTERETGKSRGFGFVTMPEAAARRVLADNLSPQIDGRVVKIAESNTTARTNTNGVTVGLNTLSDRCATCGYRPRYCTCQIPNMPGFHMPGGPMPMMGGHGPVHMPPPDDIYGPGPLPPGGMDPYYGRGQVNPDFDPEEGVAAVGAGIEVGHTVEVHLPDTVEVKEGTMTAVIVRGEVGVIAEVEVGVDLEATVVDGTGGIGETEIAIGIVKVGDAAVAEALEDLRVTVGAGVSV
eukprot:CAMPEP_0203667966 /NCGR_PEP_ID=MMETSP0090-20130426/4693_1 /ASSEMBLY_ACC=CAM_ASM_001088 /TAXON_ID=426623 /ORGANISM="Chaetoceros affinis, Strain CCMP159" /LENGTH=1087 /DNA_ID=CAMNT_0050532271 /DNA_START=360 /DNA_END=3624 /DNA_ORIENTATION=-